MKVSSPRFKAIAVTLGLSLWFFVITSAVGLFSITVFSAFVISTFVITQILSRRLTKLLDVFAIINTKLFLGILFVTVISLYGILFKILRIDLLRLKSQSKTYWLEIEQLNESRISKQY